MTYDITLLRSAQKQLSKIDRKQQSTIVTAIKQLSSEPHPTGSKKLSGRPAWRIRVGNYRIIYEIKNAELVVLVVDIGHRKDIYRSK
jgi:mRNA interferase RelE/StbE